MKKLAIITALLWIVIGGQLVAAAVIGFLGEQLQRDAPELATDVMAWIIICALAVWCAITFLEGAIVQAKRLVRKHP